MPDPKQQQAEQAWVQHLHGLADFARITTKSVLGREATPERADKLVRKIELVASTKNDEFLARIAEMPEKDRAKLMPQCSQGCAHCCYQWVRATVPEVLAVERYVREHFTAEAIEGLKERAREYRAAYEVLPPGQRMSRACPLLVGELCTAYEVRPLICRGTNSLDAQKCLQRRENPNEPSTVPIFRSMYDTATALRAGISYGVTECGFPQYDVILGYALLIALEDPEAGERFFRGEDVFEPSRAEEASKLGG